MESNLIVGWSQNYRKFEKFENREKQRKTAGKHEFFMFKIHFRFADAANHLKCAPGLRAPPR